MCELLAVSCNTETSIRYIFKGFSERSSENPHGWGIAFYQDANAIVEKEPAPARDSSAAHRVTSDPKVFRSRAFISHVRRASPETSKGYEETHPFKEELWGREWVFAHNGRLDFDEDALTMGDFKPEGDTDSEKAFCHLLGRLELEGQPESDRGQHDLIYRTILDMVSAYEAPFKGRFNILLAEPGNIYAFGWGAKHLQYLSRYPPHGTISDGDHEIDLSEEKGWGTRAVLISSRTKENLTNEAWTPVPDGVLMVARDGNYGFLTRGGWFPEILYGGMTYRVLKKPDEVPVGKVVAPLSDVFTSKRILLQRLSENGGPKELRLGRDNMLVVKETGDQASPIEEYRRRNPRYYERLLRHEVVLMSLNLRNRMRIDEGDEIEAWAVVNPWPPREPEGSHRFRRFRYEHRPVMDEPIEPGDHTELKRMLTGMVEYGLWKLDDADEEGKVAFWSGFLQSLKAIIERYDLTLDVARPDTIPIFGDSLVIHRSSGDEWSEIEP